jgi:hypothetical protein
MPTQIAVDPDQVLVDRNPANNYWKTQVRTHFSPFYTMLDETDVTNAYDRWNVLYGPGFFATAYDDPWYSRSSILGVRAGLYRNSFFSGGVYTGYRTNFRDLAAGVDGLWDHWPLPHTQVGFNIEKSYASLGSGDQPGGRGVLFGRYVLQYGSSLYLPPMEYVEVFGSVQDHPLPTARQTIPGADHFDQQSALGIHYHKDYLTPYWDPQGGYKVDATYSGGLPIFGEHEGFNRVDGQVSYVQGLPDWLGPLAGTRLAMRIYGATALPTKGEFYSLGGGDLFRGFDLKERQGSQLWVASAEWRIPIVRHVRWDCLDHILGVRNVHAALFYDVGNAYVSGHSTGPIAHSVGAGLRIDVAWFSLMERSLLRLDVAQAIDSSTPLQFWLGVRVPF